MSLVVTMLRTDWILWPLGKETVCICVFICRVEPTCPQSGAAVLIFPEFPCYKPVFLATNSSEHGRAVTPHYFRRTVQILGQKSLKLRTP